MFNFVKNTIMKKKFLSGFAIIGDLLMSLIYGLAYVIMLIGGFLKKWNELLTIPLAVVLWYKSPEIVRWFNPEASSTDGSELQALIFAIMAFLLFHGFVWIVLKISWGAVYKGIDDLDKKGLSKWQLIKVGLALYLGFLFALVFLANILM